MKIVVGLHNPEAKYAGTRHNVGAEVVDMLCDRWGERLTRGPLRVGARVAVVSHPTGRVILALPNANMNLSGLPIASLLKYYKGEVGDLVVIHDDIDLDFGRLRLGKGRGHGGHNGARNIVGVLQTKDFWRLKVGVGRPPGRMDPATYVLRRFTAAEREEVDFLIQDAADVIERLLVDEDAAIQLAGNRRPPA